MDELDTLENAYKKMQQSETNKWGSCIRRYESAFYEDIFMDAIDVALKEGNGIKHKFGRSERTLEYFYIHMLQFRDDGSPELGRQKWPACIKKYEDAFPKEAFMQAIEIAIGSGEGVKYKIGKNLIDKFSE